MHSGIALSNRRVGSQGGELLGAEAAVAAQAAALESEPALPPVAGVHAPHSHPQQLTRSQKAALRLQQQQQPPQLSGLPAASAAQALSYRAAVAGATTDKL
jgi:hypothetical protein